MKSKLVKIIKLTTLIVLGCLLTLLAVRAYDSLQGPSLEPWHTHVHKEHSIKQLNKSDWTDYLAAEEKNLRDFAQRGDTTFAGRG